MAHLVRTLVLDSLLYPYHENHPCLHRNTDVSFSGPMALFALVQALVQKHLMAVTDYHIRHEVRHIHHVRLAYPLHRPYQDLRSPGPRTSQRRQLATGSASRCSVWYGLKVFWRSKGHDPPQNHVRFFHRS